MAKSEVIKARLEASQKQRLEMIANENMTTVSDILRCLVVDYLRSNKQLELVKAETR